MGVAENNEPIIEILLPEKALTDNNIENERANLDCDKKKVIEQDKVDKIIEESLQDNSNVNLKYERIRIEELEEILEDWIKFTIFTIFTILTIWMMFAARKLEESEEEIEEIEDENEVRRDLQNNIIGAKTLQVEKSIFSINYEMFTLQVPIRKHRKPEIVRAGSAEVQKDCVKEYGELKIEFNKGKQAPCADTYFMRETAKERNINWCEKYKLKKITLVNYTERGKQLIN